MTCTFRQLDGGFMVTCGPRPRSRPCKFCGAPSTKLCDEPLHGPKTGKTCSAPMCDRCSTSVIEGIDICPPHERAGRTREREEREARQREAESAATALRAAAELDEVDRMALHDMFPHWGANLERELYAPHDDPRSSSQHTRIRVTTRASWTFGEPELPLPEVDATSWLEEVIDRQAEGAFLDAFPSRVDVTPHDRVEIGQFIFELRETAQGDTSFASRLQAVVEKRDREDARRAEAAKQSIRLKAEHVRRAGQTRVHTCHWIGCQRQVPPAMAMCRAHWFTLPQRLRDQIWRAYRIGQEVTGTPSRFYVEVMREVEEWIAVHERTVRR